MSFDQRKLKGKSQRSATGLSVRDSEDTPKYFDIEHKRGGSPVRKVLKQAKKQKSQAIESMRYQQTSEREQLIET